MRHLLAPALILVAATAVAQPRGQQREDLLDALTRHISICTEITDNTQRLACFDRLQTRIGDVQQAGPQPTPLRPGASQPNTPAGTQPLTPPGGTPATLGPQQQDPDRAFDPRGSTYRPPEGLGPKPQPPVRRTGPRPVPPASRPMPLVTLTADNLTYGEARYWQVSVGVTSNTTRTVDTQLQCTFLNGGKPIEDVYFGPVALQAGEQISTELVGPPTTAYVDSVNCKVLSP
jgi:hypothetical protein